MKIVSKELNTQDERGKVRVSITMPHAKGNIAKTLMIEGAKVSEVHAFIVAMIEKLGEQPTDVGG